MREKQLPRGHFRHEAGSYGGPGGSVPSIMCYREQSENSWVEHFCLVKPGAIFDEEDSACEHAENDLAEARAAMDAGGSVHDFAMLLRYKGYKSVSDFRAIKKREKRESTGHNRLPELTALVSSEPDTLDSLNLNGADQCQ